MKICYFDDIFVNSSPQGVFGTNWINSYTISSGSPLHRIDQKKEKQSDFKKSAHLTITSCSKMAARAYPHVFNLFACTIFFN